MSFLKPDKILLLKILKLKILNLYNKRILNGDKLYGLGIINY